MAYFVDGLFAFRARLLAVVLVALLAGFHVLLMRATLRTGLRAGAAAGTGTLVTRLLGATRRALLAATTFLIRGHFAFLSVEDKKTHAEIRPVQTRFR
jgi:hypothetical protein